MHGEATFVEALGVRRVLDAGCGTGRVAIELARRGLDVVGVDADPGMLSAARAKAPELEWALGRVKLPSAGAPPESGPPPFPGGTRTFPPTRASRSAG